MAYRFKKSEPPVKALRRVCREHIGEAQDRLQRRDHPAAIHGARKEIKKARAALRLVRPESGPDANRKAARRLRKAAKYLAASRDARVMLRAFEKLAGHDMKRFPELHDALRKHCRRKTRSMQADENLAQAVRLLRKARRRSAGLEVSVDGWPAFEPGLKLSLGRSREVFESVRREPASRNFHRWRRHVKNLWYQLCLLCPSWPRETLRFMDQLELLGEKLGEEHDLALLKEFIAKHAAAGERCQLVRRGDLRQKKLRRSALTLGAIVFSEATDTVCRRLKQEWILWRQRHCH